MKFKIRKAIALAAVAALALTGCSSKGGGSDTTGENGKTRIASTCGRAARRTLTP